MVRGEICRGGGIWISCCQSVDFDGIAVQIGV